MLVGASTPEELDAMYEDAFVLRDGAGLRALHRSAAVVVTGDGEARGEDAIVAAVARLWDEGRAYVAGERRVVQARDLAVVVAGDRVHVLSRSGDGTWRAAISLLDLETPKERKDR